MFNQVKDLDSCLMSLSKKEFLKLAYDLAKLCMSVVDFIMKSAVQRSVII